MSSQVTLRLRRRFHLVWPLLALLATIFLSSHVWTTLLIAILGLLLVCYLWARQMARNVRGNRRLRYRWVTSGDLLEEWFELNNDGILPVLWVEIDDQSTVPGYSGSGVYHVAAQQDVQWRQQAVCERRGRFTLGPWSLRCEDPFGIFEVIIRYPETEEIIIHPPMNTALPFSLPAGHGSGRERLQRTLQQAMVNAASVREYRPNDPFHHIHWPTSARRNTLFVRQFDEDAAGDAWLILDLQTSAQLGSGADSTLEQAILMAAALTAEALRNNRAVGLAAYGQKPIIIAPQRGQGQRWRILQALALLAADADANLKQPLRDLSHVMRQGSAVMVITPSGSADWIPDLLLLTQRGVIGSVAIFDRPSFDGEGNSAGLHAAIRQTGFDCHVVYQGEIVQQLEAGTDVSNWEYRVTPMGRTIVVNKPREATK
jgi:uncharacterized protein (DUF58 family)